jgi:hypothetical protein
MKLRTSMERGLIAVPVTLFLSAFLFHSCGKDDTPATQSSTRPEIVGCNSVKYQGYTFGNIGCAPGIAGFDTEINQNGHSAKFHITCSNGCVASVTVIP